VANWQADRIATVQNRTSQFKRPDNLRQRAEVLLRKSPREIAAMPAQDVQKLVHELQVHQVELEMQNEELCRVQLELETSRDRFSLLYDLAPVGYLTLDAEGVVHEANLTAAKLLGVDRRNLVRKKLTRFIAPGFQDTFYLHRQRAFTTGAKETCELQMRRPGGATFVAELESIAIHGEQSDRQQCLVALHDITERLQAEGLRQSERTLAAFFDQAPIGLLWVGADGRVQRINGAGLDLLGYSREGLLDHHVAEFHAEPDMAADLLDRLSRKETVRNYRARLRRKDGSIRHVFMDANGWWEKDQLVHSRWFVRDITQRMELEREILTIAEQEQRRIGQDLHDDLSQQLAGIEFLSQALARQLAASSNAEAAQAREIAQMVLQATNHTRELAHGLSPVRLEAEGLMDALRQLAARTEKLYHIDCRFRCNQRVLIHDPAWGIHLYRIAQEAVSNAIKHGEAKRIDVGLTTSKDRIVLAVRDNGAGIPEKLRPHQGMGLQIMQYRAGVIGGSLVVQPGANGGTAVMCTVRKEGRKTP
jgi:two-component system sensor kinase FixL